MDQPALIASLNYFLAQINQNLDSIEVAREEIKLIMEKLENIHGIQHNG